MELFKDEIEEALLATSADEKQSGVIAVRVYEKLIEQNAFLWAQRSPENLELGTNLLQLRELQYLARYGHYMRIIPHVKFTSR